MRLAVEILREHALGALRALQPSLGEDGSRRLLEVHLDPLNYAMPLHDSDREQALIEFCTGNAPVVEARRLLVLENTHDIVGVARVLARTHINRTGVSDVTRGASIARKAQSPRVVGLFDGVGDATSLRAWLDHRALADSWLAFARAHRNAPADVAFDDDDIDTLRGLQGLSVQQARTISARNAPYIGKKQGWPKVFLGVYTGLLYLESRFGLDALRVRTAVDCAQTVEQIDALVIGAIRSIQEFGPRTAPSFFADLGCTQFVKPDTHVTDVVTAAHSGPAPLGPAASIDAVRRIAEALTWPPRQVDKLMYLACSQKFYLAGLAPTKAVADRGKAELLQRLRRLPPNERP